MKKIVILKGDDGSSQVKVTGRKKKRSILDKNLIPQWKIRVPNKLAKRL